MSVIEWKQASVAGVKLRRFTGHVGGIEVGSVEFDGSNRLWTWSSPFAEDCHGAIQQRQGVSRCAAVSHLFRECAECAGEEQLRFAIIARLEDRSGFVNPLTQRRHHHPFGLRRH